MKILDLETPTLFIMGKIFRLNGLELIQLKKSTTFFLVFLGSHNYWNNVNELIACELRSFKMAGNIRQDKEII